MSLPTFLCAQARRLLCNQKETNMIPIRSVWDTRADLGTDFSPEVKRLFILENSAIQYTDDLLTTAKFYIQEDFVEQVRPTFSSALLDLTAGCELARCGYQKQAYSLWRSWYEQSLFALYFMEAPLHRQAWRQVNSVQFGREPKVKLMLHQILESSGDKLHPFGYIYTERYNSLKSRLRIDPSKERSIMVLASSRLTDLSQGVHGTYRPILPKTVEELNSSLETHGNSMLAATLEVVGMLYFLFIADQCELSDEQYVRITSKPMDLDVKSQDERLISKFIPALLSWIDGNQASKNPNPKAK